jgi:tRNA threonylcarbamoyladenosine biosynthesis protein TsaE
MRAMTLDLPDADATAELGGALARCFPGAAADFVAVHLHGDLGAGKSALARAFLLGVGVPGPVRSPTYSLVETHAAAGTIFVHMDLYRLPDGADLQELGLRDYLQPAHVLLVEWPERGAAGLPPATLAIRLQEVGAGRRARLASGDAVGAHWLDLLASDGRILSYLSNLT